VFHGWKTTIGQSAARLAAAPHQRAFVALALPPPTRLNSLRALPSEPHPEVTYMRLPSLLIVAALTLPACSFHYSAGTRSAAAGGTGDRSGRAAPQKSNGAPEKKPIRKSMPDTPEPAAPEPGATEPAQGNEVPPNRQPGAPDRAGGPAAAKVNPGARVDSAPPAGDPPPNPGARLDSTAGDTPVDGGAPGGKVNNKPPGAKPKGPKSLQADVNPGHPGSHGGGGPGASTDAKAKDRPTPPPRPNNPR
jgi:hypothetical protein